MNWSPLAAAAVAEVHCPLVLRNEVASGPSLDFPRDWRCCFDFGQKQLLLPSSHSRLLSSSSSSSLCWPLLGAPRTPPSWAPCRRRRRCQREWRSGRERRWRRRHQHRTRRRAHLHRRELPTVWARQLVECTRIFLNRKRKKGIWFIRLPTQHSSP